MGPTSAAETTASGLLNTASSPCGRPNTMGALSSKENSP